MIINSTEMQNNFGKYIELATNQEIIITKNGVPVARLLGMEASANFLSDRLVGLIPNDINECEERDARLSRQ